MARKYSTLYKPGKSGGTERRIENEQIEILWFNYRLKKPDADTKLIEGLWQYVEPIYNTVLYGTWYPMETTLWLQFLEHYMQYKIGKIVGLEIGNMDNSYDMIIRMTVEYVQRLFKGVSSEELEHIMRVTIFDMANSYKHRGTPNFSLYFSMYYTHRLQSYIKPLIKDYMYYKTMMGFREPLRHEALLEDEDYSLPESYNDWYNSLHTGNTCNEELNLDWVMGYTANIFETLSRQDRQLLKWRYVDDISVMAIGERLGLSRMSTWRHFEKIRGKLGAELSARHLLGGDSHGSNSSDGTYNCTSTECEDNTV